MSIIEEIVQKRLNRIALKGHDMGIPLPARRNFPLVPFGSRQLGTNPFVICEVKRASPSKGKFAPEIDAVKQVERYMRKGVRTVSILTEEEYFSGSLEDLLWVKQRFPKLCLLRKDFILDIEDIEVSYRAGADAVLLIASMHPIGNLRDLYSRAKKLGMEALVEVYDEDDLHKAMALQPEFTGFNSRNLATFKTDPIGPIKMKGMVNWKTEAVYESGITTVEDAEIVLSAGFWGMLIGEGVMINPDIVDQIISLTPRPHSDFWQRLFARKRDGSPLVKICGITKEEDARMVESYGADSLGFVFADSPRRVNPLLLRKIDDLDILKVGVVVGNLKDRMLNPDVLQLLSEGLLNAVQFHGEEEPADCYKMAFPYYKAIRIAQRAAVARLRCYNCPRILVDTYVPDVLGGTGKRIPDDLIDTISEEQQLWLAGGIGPDNVRKIIERHSPELIDASSLLESSPGVKDHGKIHRFFNTIGR